MKNELNFKLNLFIINKNFYKMIFWNNKKSIILKNNSASCTRKFGNHLKENSSSRSLSGKHSLISFIIGTISSILRWILRKLCAKSLTVLNCSQYLAYFLCFSTKFWNNMSNTKFNLNNKKNTTLFKFKLQKKSFNSLILLFTCLISVEMASWSLVTL